jgi:hypothetical protein
MIGIYVSGMQHEGSQSFYKADNNRDVWLLYKQHQKRNIFLFY